MFWNAHYSAHITGPADARCPDIILPFARFFFKSLFEERKVQ